jgi:type I restriction enzyme S subunit
MDNWQSKSLKDVISKTLTVDPRKTPESKFLYVDVSSVSNKTLQIENSDELLGAAAPSRARRVIREGDVIFATVRPTLRRIAVVPSYLDGEVCSTGYFVFQPTHEIHNRYLFYFLQTEFFMGEMEKLQSGASYPAVNDTQVKSQIIRYPTDIEEQKRIVAILDQAFADIETARATAERNLKNARELFDSYLQQVFSQGGEEWVDLLLEDVCSFKHGFAFKSEFFTDNPGLNLLTPGNFFEEGGYKDRGEKQKYYDGPFPKEFLLTEGSLLVAMTEQAAGLLGSPALVPDDDIFLHNQRLGLVEVTTEFEDRVSMKFLFHLFNTKYFRAKVQETATGLKVRHTSPKKMQAIPVSLPSDVNEQDSIARKLFELKEQSTKLEGIYKRKFLHLDELKKSILQKAFTGELTKSKGIAA